MNESEYSSGSDNEEEVINYSKLQSELIDNVEKIYLDVITPYLNDVKSKEMLQHLDDFSLNKFVTFFMHTSKYYNTLAKNEIN